MRLKITRRKTIKNLEKAAERVLKAIKKGETMIIYADSDPDGIASAIILKETVKNLGGKTPFIYFPDRDCEGYGLNDEALGFLKIRAPAVIFLLDCGIGNFREIEEANRLGFEVVVIDHHEILDKLPLASIIVDPKQKGDEYPFKTFSTAGILYKLSEILLKDRFAGRLKDSFLELAAVATLADMMPKIDENLILIEEGLQALGRTFRPGFQVFLEMKEIRGDNINQTVSRIIAALNAGRNKDHLNESYLFLTEADRETAKILAKKLVEAGVERKQKIEDIVQVVELKLSLVLDSNIVFEGSFDWPVTLLGPVASKICHAFDKPTFIYCHKEKESVGALRMPSGYNGVEALKKCSHLLLTYGGHPLAAGFTVPNENLEELKQCLIQYF